MKRESLEAGDSQGENAFWTYFKSDCLQWQHPHPTWSSINNRDFWPFYVNPKSWSMEQVWINWTIVNVFPQCWERSWRRGHQFTFHGSHIHVSEMRPCLKNPTSHATLQGSVGIFWSDLSCVSVVSFVLLQRDHEEGIVDFPCLTHPFQLFLLLVSSSKLPYNVLAEYRFYFQVGFIWIASHTHFPACILPLVYSSLVNLQLLKVRNESAETLRILMILMYHTVYILRS